MARIAGAVALIFAVYIAFIGNHFVLGVPDLPDKFFRCICEAESNCNREIGCVNDPDTLSCGPYQIKSVYWQDASEFARQTIGGDWMTCTTGANNMDCSKRTMLNYFERYGKYCTGGQEPTFEDYARIHNGGPKGCKIERTVSYWSRVSSCLN